MRGSVERQLVARLCLVLLLLATTAFVVQRNVEQRETEDAGIQRRLKALRALEQLAENCAAMETGVTGYALTGQAESLRQYSQAKAKMMAKLDELAVLAGGDGKLSGRMEEIARQLMRRTGDQEAVIRAVQEQGAEGGRKTVATVLKADEIDRIRQEVKSFEAEQLALLVEHLKQTRSTNQREILALGGFGGMTLTVLLGGFFKLRRHLHERYRAEARLRDGEEHLRVILRSIGDGVVATDPDGLVTRMNKEAERLTGWSEEDAVGRPAGQVLTLRSHREWKDALLEAEAAEGENEEFGQTGTAVLLSRSGATKMIAQSTVRLTGAEGRLSGLVHTFRDVTAEREAAKALERSEARYRLITEEAPYAILIQRDNRIVYANRAAVKMLGAEGVEQLTGRPLLDFVQPADQELTEARLEMLQRCGVPLPPADQRWRKVDGSAFWAQATGNPMEHEGRTAALLMLQDVSQRKEAEQAAAGHELQLRTISSNLPGGAVYRAVQNGREYRFTYIGPGIEALTGLPAEEMLSRPNPLSGLCPETELCAMWEAVERSLEQGTTLDHVLRVWTAPGKAKWLQFRAMAQSIADGGNQWDGVVVDVTARKLAEEGLQALNEKLERLVQERTAEALEAQQRWQTIFEASPAGVLILDPETTQAIEFNQTACRQLGYLPEEFRQLRLEDYEERTTVGDEKGWISSVLTGGRVEFEVQHRTKKGIQRRVHVTAKAIMLGSRLVVACIFSDVTSLRAMEATLRESEGRLRMLLEAIRDYAILSLDCDGRVTTWNHGAEEIFGWEWDEVIGRSYELLYPDKDAAEMCPRFLDRVTESGGARREGWCSRRDGTMFWGEVVLAPQVDDSGKVLGFSMVTCDRTEKMRADSEIRQQQSRLELAQQIGQLGDWEWDLRTDELRWSQQVYRIFGLDPKTHQPNQRDFLCRVHPEDRSRLDLAGLNATPGEQPVVTDFRILDTSCRVHWLNSRSFMRRDERGEMVGLYGTVQDVTERILVQSQLAVSEQRYRGIVETSTEGICLLDKSQRITFANRQMGEMLGYPPGELVGRQMQEFLFEEEKADMARDLDTVISGHVNNHDFRFRTKEAKDCWANVSSTPMRNDTGNCIGVLCVIDDITERRKLEEMYLQSQKMEAVGRLAGGIAHDFNNLLTVINGYADLMLKSLDTLDPMHGQVQSILEAGRAAAELTQQLLIFSRKKIVEPGLCNLNEIIEDAKKVFGRILGEDIELEVKLQPELGWVNVDRPQFMQVLMNLAVNARDAMPDGGSLAVETEDLVVGDGSPEELMDLRPGPYVLLNVRDSGIGMDEATRKRLFEPFFTTKETGTGLGLATVYGIVRQAGGAIRVHSAVGRGTTFKIYLPRVEEPGNEAQEQERAEAGEERGWATVLVVEDQRMLLRLTEAVLSDCGYQVLTAANAGEALLRAEQHDGPIHLLLTDVVMPGVTGRELAERLRPLRPEMQVLYMSGYTENVIAERGILEAGTAYLAKPFAPETLVHKVRNVLRKRAAGKSVLVVDDEAAVRRMIGSVLEAEGYEVAQANNGKTALQVLADRQIDLVITDLVMPEQEGLETIQAIRIQYPGTKIVAISGAFGGDYLKVAKKLGADAALSKPIRHDQLLARVDVLIPTIPA